MCVAEKGWPGKGRGTTLGRHCEHFQMPWQLVALWCLGASVMSCSDLVTASFTMKIIYLRSPQEHSSHSSQSE